MWRDEKSLALVSLTSTNNVGRGRKSRKGSESRKSYKDHQGTYHHHDYIHRPAQTLAEAKNVEREKNQSIVEEKVWGEMNEGEPTFVNNRPKRASTLD